MSSGKWRQFCVSLNVLTLLGHTVSADAISFNFAHITDYKDTTVMSRGNYDVFRDRPIDCLFNGL